MRTRRSFRRRRIEARERHIGDKKLGIGAASRVALIELHRQPHAIDLRRGQHYIELIRMPCCSTVDVSIAIDTKISSLLLDKVVDMFNFSIKTRTAGKEFHLQIER